MKAKSKVALLMLCLANGLPLANAKSRDKQSGGFPHGHGGFKVSGDNTLKLRHTASFTPSLEVTSRGAYAIILDHHHHHESVMSQYNNESSF